MIRINMDKARDIHRDTLRAMRAPLLEALDVEFLRAVEAGDLAKQGAIVARKNALRDVTKDQAITKAATPEELKAAIPAVLKA